MELLTLETKRRLFLATSLAALLAGGLSCAPLYADTAQASFAAAVADNRPDADKERDADRKPAEMLEFAQLKPGQTVVDYIAGRGYFTRLFSNAVGDKGSVYSVTPQLVIDKYYKDKPLPAVSSEPGRANVHDVIAPGVTLNVTQKADLVWTSQNYHDVHIWSGPEAAAQLNKAVFNLLKPGGLYVVLDHVGVTGLDEAGMSKVHRIDEAVVIKEVTAAGFVLDGESKVLRNPDDPHTANVFDPSIRGKTDQFILRFRKPAEK